MHSHLVEKKDNSPFSGILNPKKHLNSILHLLCWACIVQLPSWQNPEAKPGGSCYDPHKKTGRVPACQMHVVTQTGFYCLLGLCRAILESNIFSRKVASPWQATIPPRFSSPRFKSSVHCQHKPKSQYFLGQIT